MKKEKEQQEDYGLKLQESHDRWAHIYEYGCSGPFYPDGVNLDLVRNHISYYRRKIKETMTPENYPAAYFKEVPPKVDYNYIARPDEIRAAARASLAAYKADPNYQYIVRNSGDFTPKTRGKLYIDTVIGYATGLERDIENDDLLGMRRHKRDARYIELFEDCAHKMRETPPETVQFSLFSIEREVKA
ncbi:MAG: hypothetical protein LBL66_04920 [Clostridiales bacterium]|jgi:hypothetical protein|nr:hypothetical protein [Clostridiales bacterium]